MRFRVRVQGLGFGGIVIWELGFGVSSIGFRVRNLRLMIQSPELRVWSIGFRVEGLRVQGLEYII